MGHAHPTPKRIPGAGRVFLYGRGSSSFSEAGRIFKDHASLYSVASGHGLSQWRCGNCGWNRPFYPSGAARGGLGTGRAAGGGISGQPIYGDESGGGGGAGDTGVGPLWAIAAAAGFHLVGVVGEFTQGGG